MFCNKTFVTHLCSFCRKSHAIWSYTGGKRHISLNRKLFNFPVNDSNRNNSDSERSHSLFEVQSLLENAANFQEVDIPGDHWSTPVYPVMGENQGQSEQTQKINPNSTSVILFPGQGSQYVGMGENVLAYPNVKEMYDAASEILGYDLQNLCLHGPKDMLDMTSHCQAAVMVTSLAAIEKLRVVCPSGIEDCVATAGFSVGEYTALVFAGALSFEDAIRLLKVRGEAMQKASDSVPSRMMTVFLKPATKLKAICAAAREWCEHQQINTAECSVATYLFPDCRVIAGNMEALKFIEMNAADFGVLKIKYIPVSGAFHSKLMLPAKKALESALNIVKLKNPLIQVYSNVDGTFYTNVKQIRQKLAAQLCQPIMWEQTMNNIFKRPQGMDFPCVYECGPRNTMRTILRRINKKAGSSCTCIEV